MPEDNINQGGPYIDFIDWIKNKKATLNPKNATDKGFQYAAAVALIYKEVVSHTEFQILNHL